MPKFVVGRDHQIAAPDPIETRKVRRPPVLDRRLIRQARWCDGADWRWLGGR
jgi:hypothetical protein